MKKLLIANWKMNKNVRDCLEFSSEFKQKFTHSREAWIAPQALHLQTLISELKNDFIKIGAQNCSEQNEGAFTGEISPKSLNDLGCSFVILGHSERRQLFLESSSTLNLKIKNALNNHLTVVYCVGETLKEREQNQTLSIIENQIQQGLNDQTLVNETNFIIAYEPVWAIGTGKVASPKEAQDVHYFIRTLLQAKFPDIGAKIKILYGGSVKPDNVEELLSQPDIDGALVGGASLKAKDFLNLCNDK
jgi:triosephosphate isomerase (TIM)